MEIEGVNPLHLPVADLVVIEVYGQPIVEPKVIEFHETCAKIWDYILISGALIMLLVILGAFILLLIWLINPFMFGTETNN
jgi:hypothetical protein